MPHQFEIKAESKTDDEIVIFWFVSKNNTVMADIEVL